MTVEGDGTADSAVSESGDEAASSGLKGAQAEIRDALFSHDAGLFVLACGPGAGKSYTADRVAAEDLARKADAGVHAPEETLCLTSFTREDAASILPGVTDALSAFAADPDAPVDISSATAARLARDLRASDRVGTIDSILGQVFDAVADEVGFDGVPTAGTGAALALVRSDAMATVRTDETLAATVRRLDDAYPSGEYDDDLAALLSAAQRSCRERQLSVDDLREALEAVVAGAYPNGTPATVSHVLADVAEFVGEAERTAVVERLAAAENRNAIVTADATLHSEWKRAVDDFCTVLAAYVEAYDEACRANGVVAHVDVAHWVARFFTDDAYAGPFRERLRQRYTAEISTVIVDEAQDVARVQHDALAPLVDEDTRVLLVGDLQQGVYAWRNAQPTLFARAYDEGTYFGIDWATHERAAATETYRCRPGVTRAIDAVFGPVFDDEARGGAGDLDIEYEPLSTDREETAGPNVHVAAHDGVGHPGSKAWVSTDNGVSEADALADCIATGLREGRFATDETPDPSVTVLFHRRTHMGRFAEACSQRGLSVRDASRALFDHPLVMLVCAVCSWLVEPTSTQRTNELRQTLTGPENDAFYSGMDALMRNDMSVRAAAASGQASGVDADILDGLVALADQRARHRTHGGAALVESVIDELDLERDPLDRSDARTDDVAVLDRLIEVVADWEGSQRYSPAQTAAALAHARDDSTGPELPAAPGSFDVTFRTIHDAKGDEDDVIALADIAQPLDARGPHADRFLAHGRHLALAPPANCARPDGYPDLEGTVLSHGPYWSGAAPWDGEAGLRWASTRWADDADGPRFAGPAPLSAAVADIRAERWRLLFVALSRARDHLVLPLPEERDEPAPRDSWADTLRSHLAFDATRRGEYRCTPETGEPFRVAVHRTDPTIESATERDSPETVLPARPERQRTPGWTARFLNPSTLYPLSSAPREYLLDHLQNRALHAPHDGTADGLPLGFETMGPDLVGTVAHDVFAAAIAREVDTETLRNCVEPLEGVLNSTIDEEARGVDPAERDLLRAYVADTLCPQFAASDLWDRLQASRVVYIEEPLDTVVRVAGLDIEVGGQADVVSIDAEGRWHVDDVKVTLHPFDEEIRDRYELQTAAYAWILRQHPDVDAAVVPTVTTLGVEEGTLPVSVGDAAVREAVESLTGLAGDWR